MAWLGRRRPSGLRRSAGAGRGRPDWPEAARVAHRMSRVSTAMPESACRTFRAGVPDGAPQWRPVVVS
ncbi:hypothetical protein BURMUCGD1_5913 [Burkholderia multivorans CGD1]|nr:hypothetical protein BURMUCGD1_5913 [Burkholderia multivorans CGD1]